ncbi:hypothetical protein VNO77_08767 [Canavalia gladiata]|uniref:Uncharacterized protein n=1 Tax=Canavalia gladiata TaxID=3824 RepID=A0AAN9ME79_CANGL
MPQPHRHHRDAVNAIGGESRALPVKGQIDSVRYICNSDKLRTRYTNKHVLASELLAIETKDQRPRPRRPNTENKGPPGVHKQGAPTP